ncbi:MAG: hypothetical protein MJE77_43445 [Proteobacteria bacterium]|nr:hypothetical protein [Pseudomonadota bacterium]
MSHTRLDIQHLLRRIGMKRWLEFLAVDGPFLSGFLPTVVVAAPADEVVNVNPRHADEREQNGL